MNDRFRPGGDKYESIREDERRAFYDRVDAEKEEILSALKTVVSCWTENQVELGYIPVFDDFLDQYPEWDHEKVHANIAEEMERVSLLCRKDAIANIASGLGGLSNGNLKAAGE